MLRDDAAERPPACARDDLEIVALDEVDEPPSVFDCGDPDRNRFLLLEARDLHAADIVKTYVAYHRERGLAGFVAVRADVILLDQRERKRTPGASTQGHPRLPAVLVAHVARSLDVGCAYRGIGTHLMAFAVGVAISVRRYAGCRFLTLDAIERSIGFYERLGFVRNKAVERERAKQREPRASEHPSPDPGELSFGPTQSMRIDLLSEPRPAWFPKI